VIHGATLSEHRVQVDKKEDRLLLSLNLEKGCSAAEIAEAGNFHIFLAIETQEDHRVHRVGMKDIADIAVKMLTYIFLDDDFL